MNYPVIKRLRREIVLVRLNWKLFLSTFIMIYYLSFPIKNYIFYLEKPVAETQVIDFFHNLLPEVKGRNIHDIPQSILWTYAVSIFVAVPVLWKRCHQRKVFFVKNFIQVGVLTLIIFTIRYCTFFMTIIPDPNSQCKSPLKIPKPQNVYGKNVFPFEARPQAY